MNDADQAVLAALDAPMTHKELVQKTGLARSVEKAAVMRLARSGAVFTVGSTAAVRVLTPAVAINESAIQLEAAASTLRAMQGNSAAAELKAEKVKPIYGAASKLKWQVAHLAREVSPPQRTGRPRKVYR